ncbi:uncharacterized protein LOC130137414 [Syzygium oleosum]|uniref:uncharacterized protein LOC130137414 n=1 Tax=Syzygium oleosum TaxID=219896 RepID=UPI0024B962EB|nr:uncharacterized protein LOC130137414 [Syzygium oleosum]
MTVDAISLFRCQMEGGAVHRYCVHDVINCSKIGLGTCSSRARGSSREAYSSLGRAVQKRISVFMYGLSCEKRYFIRWEHKVIMLTCSGRILDKAIQLVSCERTHLIFAHDLFARLFGSPALTSKKESHCCELCVTSCQLGCSGGMSRQGWGDDYDINLPINSSSCGY